MSILWAAHLDLKVGQFVLEPQSGSLSHEYNNRAVMVNKSQFLWEITRVFVKPSGSGISGLDISTPCSERVSLSMHAVIAKLPFVKKFPFGAISTLDTIK